MDFPVLNRFETKKSFWLEEVRMRVNATREKVERSKKERDEKDKDKKSEKDRE